MGVYIPKMRLPESCWNCPLSVRDDILWCSFTDGSEDVFKYSGVRAPWCPLVEIPKHGRLIDADAIKRDIDANRPDRIYEDAWTLTVIDDAPTVIESEE